MTATPPATVARLSDAAITPLHTLDPAVPLDDLTWLDEAIGDARVVAIGESAHYNAECYLLRHRLLHYLVERHGFSACAWESGFTEGWLLDAWIHGGDDQLGNVLANGMTSLMGLWTQMRAQVEWMRQRTPPVSFYGIDLGGSNISLLPGLDAVLGYLSAADHEFAVDPSIRQTAAVFAVPSAFSAAQAIAAYTSLPPTRRDALTAGLADLVARMTAQRLDYVRRTSVDAYKRAVRSLSLTTTLDLVVRDITRDAPTGIGHSIRDVGIADTVEWVLRHEDRIVLPAHNGHIQRWTTPLPGFTATPMGMHLAERLGKDYLVIGVTNGTGQTLNTGPDFFTGTLFTELNPPRPGSLDALMAASHDGPFAVDLRRLSPDDASTLRAITQQRYGNVYGDINPMQAYDLIVHLPHVTAAEPDQDALSYAPADVQRAFSEWRDIR